MASLLRRKIDMRKSLATKVLSAKRRSSLFNRKRTRENSNVNPPLFGSHSIRNLKPPGNKSNEDRVVFGKFTPDDMYEGPLTAFAAVFDGHGGFECAEYISKVVSVHLRENFLSEEDWENGEEVMREVFANIDKEFCKIAMNSRNHSGCCATIVAIRDNLAFVANIGDCRAVMVPVNSSGTYLDVHEVTNDHRATGYLETQRIEEAGGKVSANGRIGPLEPSRCFGDVDVKIVEGDAVIAQPDVDFVEFGENAFMIIATDGVWDEVSNKEASNIVKGVLKRNLTDVDKAAEKLAEHARKNDSIDDITVCVIVF